MLAFGLRCRYICSCAPYDVFAGMKHLVKKLASVEDAVLRDPAKVGELLTKDNRVFGCGNFMGFVAARHLMISGAIWDGALGRPVCDNALPPNDKGTSKVMQLQANWASAKPTRLNVLAWSRRAAQAARVEVPLGLDELFAEENESVRNDPQIRKLFALTKLEVQASSGVVVGETWGCDLQWDVGGLSALADRLEKLMYMTAQAWSLHEERHDWPVLIEAELKNCVRAVRLDLASDEALDSALRGELVAANVPATQEQKAAAATALRIALDSGRDLAVDRDMDEDAELE